MRARCTVTGEEGNNRDMRQLHCTAYSQAYGGVVLGSRGEGERTLYER